MFIENLQKYQCTGCEACLNSCPVKAITMTEDRDGFRYPVIDASLCRHCGLCEKHCPAMQATPLLNRVKNGVGIKLKDKKALYASTSGGVFTAVSDIVLENNGCVCAATLNESLKLHHTFAYDKQSRDKMRGTWYIQSEIGDAFLKIEEILKQGTLLLFVGTPCEVSGLHAFLSKPYQNLLTLDFICHGIPGQSLFNMHIADIEKMYGCKVKSYSFRSKRYGWNHGIDEAILNNGKVISSGKIQTYTGLFQLGISHRPCCSRCKYCGSDRPSDLTMGDFFDIEKITKKKERQGYSLLLINTDKGKQFAERLCAISDILPLSFDAYAAKISGKPYSCRYPQEAFFQCLQKSEYAGMKNSYYRAIMKKHLKHPLLYSIKIFIKKKLYVILGKEIT